MVKYIIASESWIYECKHDNSNFNFITFTYSAIWNWLQSNQIGLDLKSGHYEATKTWKLKLKNREEMKKLLVKKEGLTTEPAKTINFEFNCTATHIFSFPHCRFVMYDWVSFFFFQESFKNFSACTNALALQQYWTCFDVFYPWLLI